MKAILEPSHKTEACEVEKVEVKVSLKLSALIAKSSSIINQNPFIEHMSIKTEGLELREMDELEMYLPKELEFRFDCIYLQVFENGATIKAVSKWDESQYFEIEL